MQFPDTRWTLIAHLNDPAKVDAALDQLCRAYWPPVHAYLMRSGYDHAQAQDLTQDFLGMVVRQRLLERADPAAGTLRAWLLASLRHFLANARRHDARQKRGAGRTILPLDHEEAAGEGRNLAAAGLSPDEAFDRAWVNVLLRRVLDGLARQYGEAGRAAELTALLPWLLDHADAPQAEAAAAAGMTVARFRVQLHRLRGRYRESLRQEIVATLRHEADYEQELAYLFGLMDRSA